MVDTVSKEKRREISLRSRWKNIDYVREYNKQYTQDLRENRYETYVLRRVKSNCRKTGIEVTITESDILIPTHCPILGIELDRFATTKTRSNAPSIDRIDNNKGYIPGNIIIVSLKANRIKNDATVEELMKVAEFYKGLQGINTETNAE